jgi:hypothetical protein
MGQIAARYPHSDSVLTLCTLCGKNMSEEGIACGYIDSRHYEKQETPVTATEYRKRARR